MPFLHQHGRCNQFFSLSQVQERLSQPLGYSSRFSGPRPLGNPRPAGQTGLTVTDLHIFLAQKAIRASLLAKFAFGALKGTSAPLNVQQFYFSKCVRDIGIFHGCFTSPTGMFVKMFFLQKEGPPARQCSVATLLPASYAMKVLGQVGCVCTPNDEGSKQA